MEDAKYFLLWLAKSPVGVALKVGVWAALSWTIANIDQFNMHPMLVAAICAGGVVLTDALNPQDGRFGVRKNKGKTPNSEG